MKTACAYKLKGGAIVHPACRETFVAKQKNPSLYPGIEAAMFPGYEFQKGQVCKECGQPIEKR